MWTHKIGPLFLSFISHSFLFHHCMAMTFLQFVQNLPGFVIQVTEWKYSISITRYYSLSNKIYFVPTCSVFAGPVTYVGCLYPFYFLCTMRLKLSSATIFDLCVLCANIYNLLFGLFLFNNVVSVPCIH